MNLLVNAVRRIIKFETRGMSLVSGITYFFGVPLLVAFILGWNHVIVGKSVPTVISLIFWTGLVMTIWFTSIASCHVAYLALRKWEPQLIFVLLAGLVISTVVLLWPVRAYSLWGVNLGKDVLVPNLPAPVAFSFDYISRLINHVLPGAFLWFATNFFYAKVLGVPRYSYLPEADPAVSKTDDSTPVFMSRLPAPVHGRLIALKAEDHYVRVFTDNGNSLVHYRFNDAISDVSAHRGLRTHRSYWVRTSEIVNMRTNGHRTHLTLSNGLKAPVSRSYLNDVKRSLEQAGRSGNPDPSQATP